MRALAAGLLLMFGATQASGQVCTFAVTDITFNPVSMITGAAVDTTGTLSINCTGTVLTTVRICPNLGPGSGGATSSAMRQMLGPGGVLNYQLYSNAGRTAVWGSTTYASGPPTFDIGFGGSTTIATTRTIYGRVFASQTAQPATTYTSIFSGADTLFTYGITATGAGSCPTILLPITASPPPFTVRAIAVNNCSLTATDINFGSQGPLVANVDSTGSLSVQCTTGTIYNISLNGGLAGAAPTARQMTNGASAVTYGLYQNAARNQTWGSTIGTNTVSSTGTGAVQPFTVYARVPPQATPAAGTYSDTIIVTITY